MESIKILRDKSGAGMVDCKTALEETVGDIEKALELLRKKGMAKAAKRTDKEAIEGIVLVAESDDAKKGYIAEFNCETDFVARNDKFLDFAHETFGLIREREPESLDELLALKMSDGNSVKEDLESLSGIIGEKLEIRSFDILSTKGSLASYSHQGGRIGVLAALDRPDSRELAYEIAMQIAAANPKYAYEEQVASSEIKKETEIYGSQLEKEGKPENIRENIIKGKLKKFFEEIVLVEQEYIKDDKMKVKDLLNGAKIEKFIRYSL